MGISVLLCGLLCIILSISIVGSSTPAVVEVEDSPADQVAAQLLRRDTSGGGFCNATVTCGDSSQGSCVNGSCVCTKGWANPNCSYDRKSRLTAFLLAFFVGHYGADRFYLGYIGDGVGKILLIVFGFLLCCCGMVTAGVGGGLTKVQIFVGCGVSLVGLCIALVGALCVLASYVWWLVDWILILEKNLDDDDGYSLEDDF